MDTLPLDFTAKVEQTSPADVFAHYRDRYIVPLQESLDNFKAKMAEAFTELHIGDFSREERMLFQDVEQSYVYQLRSHLNKAFESQGITNYELKEFKSDDTLVTYWDRACSKSELYRKEGLAKYADRMRRFINHRKVTNTKSGFSLSSDAYLDSFDSSRYSYQECRDISDILSCIKGVLKASGMKKTFHSELLEEALRQPVESRRVFKVCEGVELQTFKSTLKYHFSFEVMEALQLFISEHQRQSA